MHVVKHLTNVAIQKNDEKYDEKKGGKWMLQNLRLYLISKYERAPRRHALKVYS